MTGKKFDAVPVPFFIANQNINVGATPKGNLLTRSPFAGNIQFLFGNLNDNSKHKKIINSLKDKGMESIKLANETEEYLQKRFPDLTGNTFEALKKYFVLRVIGIKGLKQLKQDFGLSKKSIRKSLVDEFGVTETIFDSWDINIGDEIDRIKSAAILERRQGFGSRGEFLKWYLEEPKKCFYCGSSAKEVEKFFKTHKSKRDTRGNSLEIDRKDPRGGYKKSNCVFSCYYCNNAKSDIFSEEEFKSIGVAIGKVIRQNGWLQVIVRLTTKFIKGGFKWKI
jgi:hypothetical protein